MDTSMKPGSSMESQVSLGNSRVNLGSRDTYLVTSASNLHQVDVSTQADICPEVVYSYESEDETMGRRNKIAGDLLQRNKKGTPLYSKEDIREQYCINNKQLDVLEKARGSGGLFGCLSNYHESSCRSRNSLLSVCVRRKVPSDENLQELYRRPPAMYAPMPRWPRYAPPPPPDLYPYDEDLDCSYFRRRPKSYCNADPKRYTWMPEDEDSTRMERPRPIRPDLDDMHSSSDYETSMPNHRSCLANRYQHAQYMSYSTEYLPGPHHAPCPAHPDLPPPPPPPQIPPHDHAPPHRTKHVSFARSHTLTSFDDAVVGIGSPSVGHTGTKVVIARSQERLIDGKKTPGDSAASGPGDRRLGQGPTDSPKVVFLEKLKRGPMKTQATQTEVCLGRKPHAPNYLSLSPRTVHRVRMVSQGAQTNGGDRNNTSRRLMKSYSEAGGRFLTGIGITAAGNEVGYHQLDQYDDAAARGSIDHEPLHRTQSEEPPRSPFLVTTPPEALPSTHISSTPPGDSTSTRETSKASPEHSETSTKTKSGKEKTYKEIFIDFEPQGVERRGKKRMLQKTLSEGEILIDRRRTQTLYNTMDVDLLADPGSTMMTSASQEGISDDRNYEYYQHSHHADMFLEPLEKKSASLFSSIPADLAASSCLLLEDPQEDEFHENLIYRGLFRKRSVSLEDAVSSTTSDPDMPVFQQQMSQDEDEDISETKSRPMSDEQEVPGEDDEEVDEEEYIKSDDQDMRLNEEDEEGEEVEEIRKHGRREEAEGEASDKNGEALPPTTPLTQRSSPFASCDSLANDLRDHSDGNWNESQATVLHADSDTNGTGVSCSDLTSMVAASNLGAAVLALTPSSRRKQLLLLQHQQRSSMDTEALDEELEEKLDHPKPPMSPRQLVDMMAHPKPTVSVTMPSQDIPSDQEDAVVPFRSEAPVPVKVERTIVPAPRETAISPSPHPRELRRRHSPAPVRAADPTAEPSAESAVPGAPDFLLARTDSGKTNTDVSETSTTTEDYVTANDNNSGTDTSSKRSGSYYLPKDRSGSTGVPCVTGSGSIGSAGAGDGSSFDSASSMYSLAKELTSEDHTHISCSPPPILEENSSDLPTTPLADSEDNQTSTTPRVSVDLTSQKPGSLRELTSPSAESSSSSGSYSVDGSFNGAEKLTTTAAAPVVTAPIAEVKGEVKAESGSEEEHSGHSSSGYYESPVEDEEGDGISGSERREWTDEEKRRKKKGFKLDFSPILDKDDVTSPPSVGKRHTPHKEGETWSRRSSGKSDRSGKEAGTLRRDRKSTTPPGAPPAEGESRKERAAAQRRGKSRSRSPVQHHRRTPSALPGAPQSVVKKAHRDTKTDKEPITPGMVRSPAMHEGFRTEDWGTLQRSTPVHTPEEPATLPANNTGTSDDSSCGHGPHPASENNNQSSPRRHRRVRESPRRKQAPTTGGRSPTSTQQRLRRRSSEDKGASSVTALARRRSSIPAKSPCTAAVEAEELSPSPQSLVPRGSRLSPHRYSRSPGGSPSRRHRSKGSPKLLGDQSKGLMSPDAARLKAVSAESLRSVSPGSDSVFYSESADHSSNTVTLTDKDGLLCHHCGREVDKSTLSGMEECEQEAVPTPASTEQEDIVQPPAGFADSPEGSRNKAQTGGRLYKKLEKRFRSEERGHGEKRHHSRFRCDGVRAKSEERGKEDRVKVRPLARSTDASMEVLRGADSSPNTGQDSAEADGGPEEEEDIGVYADSYKNSTWIYIGDSEEIHVWQKPETRVAGDKSGEDQETTLRRGSAESTGSEREFKRKYQAITHRMVHRKSSVEMYKRLASKSFECDKTVVVRRESGEFGFRIHGSRPVVVSAIEPDTPAETSGLEVGDIVISVNGVNVLDASHSEVVKIAHAGSDTLELEVARTCNVLTPVVREPGAGTPLYSGYLWKLGGSVGTGANNKKWIQRWFCLKRDNCLYYYKNDSESQPLGALMLANYSVSRTADSGRPHSFLLGKAGAAELHLAADTEEAALRWLAVMSHSIERNTQLDEWLDISNRNLNLAASAVQTPDCFGYLMKLGHKWKSWKRRYCVLKDACLYFYQEGTSESAIGMACLHGYRVQNSTAGGKRYAFEILPPEQRQRQFYFCTETEMDKKRWLAALEYSIDRWIKVG